MQVGRKLTVGKADHPVAAGGKFRRVGHQDQGRAMAVAQAEQKIHDRLTVRAVKVAGRLIRQKDGWPGGGGAGKGDALLLAARKLGGVVVHAGRKADRGQFSLCPGKGVGGPGKLHRQCHVLQRGHRRNKVEALEHNPHIPSAEAGKRVFVHRGKILAKRQNLAAGGALQPGHKHEER